MRRHCFIETIALAACFLIGLVEVLVDGANVQQAGVSTPTLLASNCHWDKQRKIRVCDDFPQQTLAGSALGVGGWRPWYGKSLPKPMNAVSLAAEVAGRKAEARAVAEAKAAVATQEAAAKAAEITNRCGRTLRPDGASVLPNRMEYSHHSVSGQIDTHAHHEHVRPLLGKEAAKEWWNCTVLGAMLASPPTVGRSTLLFVHVPKAGGLSVSLAFDKLVQSRRPLCSKRFTDSLHGKPVAMQHAGTLSDGAGGSEYSSDVGCARGASNLVWGRVPLDLVGAASVSAPREEDVTPAIAQVKTRQSSSKAAQDLSSLPPQYPETLVAWSRVPVYSLIILREPFERLVSYANFIGVAQAEFEGSWARQMATNTMTSMINGLGPIAALNKNRFAGEPHSCQRNPTVNGDNLAHALIMVDFSHSYY